MYYTHSALFPETPRLRSVALPEDLNEDNGFLTQAYRPTIAPIEGNTLGLLGMIASSAVPFMKDLKRRFQSFSIDVSPGKTSPKNMCTIEPPSSPSTPIYSRSGRAK